MSVAVSLNLLETHTEGALLQRAHVMTALRVAIVCVS